MSVLADDVFGFDTIRSKQFETKADLLNYHRRKITELEGDTDGQDTPLTQISNVQILFDQMNNARQLELEMNAIIEERNMTSGYDFEIDTSAIETFPIKVNFYKDKCLVIETPIIFKNAERYSNSKQLCMLAREVDCARKLYEKQNNTSLAMTIKSPYWLIMLRKVRKGKTGNVADTDNIEAKKISNIISKFLFLSDAVTVKRDLTLCEEVENKEDVGTCFIIAEEDNVMDILEHYIKQKRLSDWLSNL